MFGTDDQNQANNDDPAMLDNVKQLASQPSDTVVPPQPQTSTPAPATPFSPAPQANPASAEPAPVAPTQPEHPAEPAVGFSNTPDPEPSAAPAVSSPADSSSAASVGSMSVPADSSAPSPFAATSTSPSPTVPSDNPAPSASTNDVVDDSKPAADPQHLSGLKKQALDHLEPLTDHIEGTPEETFRTTMMMIQANDNHTLLEKALASAKNIENDKERAQALLDIINEINYFAALSDNDKNE